MDEGAGTRTRSTPPGPLFICHSSKDAGVVAKLVGALESQGLACWVAPRNVPPGRDYATEITAAIKACTGFVLVYTRSSAQAMQCLNELELAFRAEKPIYPIRMDTAPIAETYEYRLARTQWISGPLPAAVAALVGAVGEQPGPASGKDQGDHRSRRPLGRVGLAAVALAFAAAVALGAYTLVRAGDSPSKADQASTVHHHAPVSPSISGTATPRPRGTYVCWDGRHRAQAAECTHPAGLRGLRYMFPSFNAAYLRGVCQRQRQDIVPRVRTESWRCPTGKESWINYSAWYSWRQGFDHYENKYSANVAQHGQEFIAYPAEKVGYTAGATQTSRIFSDERLALSVTALGTSKAQVDALMATVRARPSNSVHMSK